MSLKFKKFDLPEKVLNQLYELTGKNGSYKGLILAYSSEDGQPVVFTKCDSQITEFALQKALENYLAESSEDWVMDDTDL
jgi:hypothetical protein